MITLPSVKGVKIQRTPGGQISGSGDTRHRWAVADLVHLDERELWPDPDGIGGQQCRELKGSYPHRSAVPRTAWQQLFAGAEREISILVYAALFLAEDVELTRLLADKARAGVVVRLLMADPDSSQVADRGTEEGIGAAVAARVQNALALFRPLLSTEGVEARQHETVLYNSIFRADDQMLINPQVHGIAAAYAPVLDLRRVERGGMFDTYADSYERVWLNAVPLTASDLAVTR